MQKTIRREILAGLSTFFTMAYLLLLYPQILSEGGIDIGSALTATIATLATSTLFLAIYTNFPAVLAPGLSVGPFLVYTVILKQGVAWQTTLGLVFWAGLCILILSLLKIRQKILLNIPQALKFGAISGIGLFLICVGLKDLGITLYDPKSLFTLNNSIAIVGLALFYLLHQRKVDSAFLIVILTCWGIGLLTDSTQWKGLAAWPPSLLPTLFQLDLLSAIEPKLWGTLLTIVLICLIDSSASLTALARLSGFVTEKGHIHKIDRIVIPDGAGSIFASLLGTGSLSFLLESSSGIKGGGRTRITTLTVVFCSLLCLFLYPLISSIPLFATSPALIAIGWFMALDIRLIPWKTRSEWVPALITLITIPLTFSIYQGFAFGFISYVLIQVITGKAKQIDPVCWTLAAIFLIHLVTMLY